MREIWNSPRYCISVREKDIDPDAVRNWMRRKPCCDCGSVVIYEPAQLLWELLRPFIIICNVCATARKLEAGGMSWTYGPFEPRPRDP